MNCLFDLRLVLKSYVWFIKLGWIDGWMNGYLKITLNLGGWPPSYICKVIGLAAGINHIFELENMQIGRETIRNIW